MKKLHQDVDNGYLTSAQIADMMKVILECLDKKDTTTRATNKRLEALTAAHGLLLQLQETNGYQDKNLGEGLSREPEKALGVQLDQ
ncbi:hypothetical protein F2Q70_00029474 [Brassica cretica]|uniref:Uncharacterized protein n=1 Tax=Brassica cretica TaxID=69181 RepID=A0A8S9FM11_BRACR|nr:hypothetical protein F2Q70_00029474 [Brassica cretica]